MFLLKILLVSAAGTITELPPEPFDSFNDCNFERYKINEYMKVADQHSILIRCEEQGKQHAG